MKPVNKKPIHKPAPMPHKPVAGKPVRKPAPMPHKPVAGKPVHKPAPMPHKPVAGKPMHKPAPMPHKPVAGKPVHKPAPVPHKPVTGKSVHKPAPVPHPVKGAAGAGFRNFKNGVMLNDGQGDLDDRNDWLETIPTASGDHIASYYLTIPYKEWIYNFQHDCTMDPDFMHWLFHVFVPREEAKERRYPHEWVSDTLTRKEMLNGIKNERVIHLNSNERKKKIIRIDKQGYLIDQTNRPYHTGARNTIKSGNGWAMFVTDEKNTIYSDSDSIKFHHSSFLAGNYVSSAGEIAVKHGKLVGISCKSGHYRPTKKNMIHFLEHLNKHNVNLRNIPIQLEWNIGWNSPIFYDAYQVLIGKYKQIAAPQIPV